MQKFIGLKLICERKDGEITTWNAPMGTTIKRVVNNIKHHKDWIGGKFTEVYIYYYDDNGVYQKIQVNIEKMKLNSLLKERFKKPLLPDCNC